MERAITRAELRAAIPNVCFERSTARALGHLFLDYSLIAILYLGVYLSPHWALQLPLIFLIGTVFWGTFVIGHEAGHGSFSRHARLNTLVGLISHGIILVPYRSWQRSHAMHHKHTGHLKKEEVFRAVKPHQEVLAHMMIFRTPLFLLFGWPLYLIGLRNAKQMHPVKNSHFTTASDLYSKPVKISYWASIALVAAFAAAYTSVWILFGFAAFATYILLPYLVFAGWLTFVTYMQHVSPEVPVHDEETWTGLNGALSTVDRNYFPFNRLTHRIGDCHVIHHLFPTIPHYHAKTATEAIKPLLGQRYLSSNRSVWVDFFHTLTRCHFVERDTGGTYRYKSAYPFVPNFSAAKRRQNVPVAPAE
ncbi:MAG: fatty acid desaturase [Pseudomonadota bacterium]